ncbi:MAG TPA: CNNM domain-containing protein [Verrucomicrobiae bacterium]|jgi:CBS domain containing-hemolysin-like protein|nr:CNNM domain-containing protein [Verrucomicrobiae bacterium]
MSDRGLITLLAFLFCLTLSFLFSGMESGVMALNHVRIRKLKRSGDRRAAALESYLSHPEHFLWTILVGNTVVNFVVFALGAMQLRAWLGGRPALWVPAFAAAIFMFYIVCELLPKTLFQRRPNRLTLMMAEPFRLLDNILTPLAAVADWFARGLLRLTGGRAFTGRLFGSREELRFMMQEAAHGLTSEERLMINRVLDLQTMRAGRVTVPMANVAVVEATAPLSAALALSRERQVTRLPVIDQRTGRIIGVIGVDQVLYREDVDVTRSARDYMQPAYFLPADVHLEEAMRRMQRAGVRLAVVLAPDQRELGVLSLQDILKVIFGRVSS